MSDIPPPFDAAWFRFVLGLIVGLALGSFVTMSSYRLPRKLSIVKPDSFCPACKTPLTARDLVPVFSWAALKGKCSHCGVKISARYPLIELATGLSCAFAFAAIGFTPFLIVSVAVMVVVIASITIKIENK